LDNELSQIEGNLNKLYKESEKKVYSDLD